MKVPTEVRELTRIGLEAMYKDPSHHFDWHTRRDIYHQFCQAHLEQCNTVRGWLAVLAAEHVLPLFTSTFPEDDLPVRLLDTTIQIVEGKTDIDSHDVEKLWGAGYQGLGIDAVEWRGKVAYNAEYAGWSCYKALMEVRGKHDLFEGLSRVKRGPTGGYEHEGNTTRVSWPGISTRRYAGWQSGESFTDADMAHLAAYGDTAGAAAMASACAVEELRIDSNQLLTFWEWWANSAMPEAWNKVEAR